MLSRLLGVCHVHSLSLAQDGSSCPEVCALCPHLPQRPHLPQHLVPLLLPTVTLKDLFSFLQAHTPSSVMLFYLS